MDEHTGAGSQSIAGLENKTTFGSSQRKFINVEQGPGAQHYEPKFGQFSSHDPRFDGPTPEPIRSLVEPSKRMTFDQMHGSSREVKHNGDGPLFPSGTLAPRSL